MDLSSQQAVAVLGIGLIAMGDEVGSQVREGREERRRRGNGLLQMALRMFGHLIRYGEAVIRRAVPLAMALLSVSEGRRGGGREVGKEGSSLDEDVDNPAKGIL